MNQSTALKILKSGANVFLTGSAGSGKTYVINQYIEHLREQETKIAITASTGIAATHIGGQTIHSWSGLGIKDEISAEILEKMAKKRPLRKRIEEAEVLIIDEISMLSRSALQNIDEILRFFKVSFEPFGGIQVILSGDFFQLPPVSRERLPNYLKFAFMAPVWVKADFQICYLTEQFRQGNDQLTDLLNEIRSGEISDAAGDLIREKLEESMPEIDEFDSAETFEETETTEELLDFERTPLPDDIEEWDGFSAENSEKPIIDENWDESAVRLFTHNADVDKTNLLALMQIQAESRNFFANATGTKQLIATLKKSILAPVELELKVGARVIFVKNNYEEGYMNGTLGQVIDFSKDGWPIVLTHDEKEIVAKPATWKIDGEDGKPVASLSQLPLRLAWAITVHKSQGMTIDRAEIDLSKTFEPGQGYVALSRVRTWDGLVLKGCNAQALMLDELALKADNRFQELSEAAEVKFAERGEKD